MMLSRLAKTQIFNHLVAILLVSLIACVTYFSLSKLRLRDPVDGLYLANMGSGSQATENLLRIRCALSSGKTAVILGSSELTTPVSTYMPYNFLPKALNVPVLAYGHAFFQSFAMYGLLAANSDALTEDTRLILLVSPGWFSLKSIPSGAFVEHFQPQVLSRLYFVPTARNLVKGYILAHQKEFGPISPAYEAFLSASGPLIMAKMAAKEAAFSLKMRVRKVLAEHGPKSSSASLPARVLPTAAQWKEYEAIAQKAETSLMRNNHRWVRDDYFTQYLRDLPPEGTTYFPGKMDINPELVMLARTLELLQEKKVRALVVFQTLNPHVYRDAKQAKSIGREVSALAAKTGMQFFDMNDVPEYIPGTLRDSMHIGELGWVEIDRRIMEYMGQE